jgi:hypothetical protein
MAGLLLLATAGAASAAALAPPKSAVSGKYTFTFRATNVKGQAPGVLDVNVVAACAAPCTIFTTRWTARGQKKSTPVTLRWKWNGRQYVYGPRTNPGASPCAGRNKKSVAAGYDIVSKYALTPVTARGGRVTTFRGTGIDDYVPNGKGRKAGCTRGEYDFAITAVTP